MNQGVLALFEVLLIFGGALAVALHQLYQLRADKRRAKSEPDRDGSGSDPPPRG